MLHVGGMVSRGKLSMIGDGLYEIIVPLNTSTGYVMGLDLASGPDMTSYRDEKRNVTFNVNDNTPPIQS